MRCRHCGHENPGKHRFCGMCGKTLEEDEVVSESEEHEAESGTMAAPARKQEDAPTPAPAYTGGMFNLGQPAEKSSRNLDYLLVDDEPRSRKGLVLGILALVLVAGLGWLRWKNGGFPWLTAKSNKPAAAQSAPTDADGNDGATTSGTDTANPNTSGSNATTTPASGPTATQPPAATPNNAANGGAPPTGGDKAAPPSDAHTSNAAPATSDGANASAAPSAPGGQAAAQPDQSSATASSAAPQPSSSGDADKTAEATPPPAAALPKPKPAPKPAAKPEDPVTLGEKYLYGRGVTQDCTKGLRYVKPAADKSNAKAMITMGALYATGHCLSRDLPTAYRFFALALRQDPENGPLKQNVEMVWGQMTPLERQQALRLTQ